ncbi:hypothetical protein PsyrB_13350 [Pseudomonas syringae pv. syringae B301D]|nr:hypothetical protein PsyrB_13350 [Pseudomonas syringae pv. syringae B301D]
MITIVHLHVNLEVRIMYIMLNYVLPYVVRL